MPGSRYPLDMPHVSPGVPGDGEYPPYAIRYVELVPELDVISVLQTQIDRTVALVVGSDGERARTWRYAPGKWTLNEVVGHLADTERVLGYRALVIARGDATPLPSFEQDDYVANGPFADCSLDELMEEFQIVRAATLALFHKLQPESWIRAGMAANARCTVRGLAYFIAGHERYHLRILRERYLS